MEPLLQVINLGRKNAPPLSFTLMQGEARTLHIEAQSDVAQMVDVFLGRHQPEKGIILFRGRPLSADDANRIGWVAANGGLISGLTIWENVTLPLCYHHQEPPPDMEERLAYWLDAVGITEAARAAFLSSWPAQLGPLEQKQAGLARGLLHGSALLLVEGRLFGDVSPALRKKWEQALAGCLDRERGLLVVTSDNLALPWALLDVFAEGGGTHVVEPI